MIKKLLALMVLVMVASLSVAGCTTNNSNQTPSAATQHNAVLESVVSSQKADTYRGGAAHVKAWQVTWLNDSSVNVQSAISAANITISSNDTLTAFPTTDAATAYLKSLNLSQYHIVSTDYRNKNDSVLGTFTNVTGHPPTTYVHYMPKGFDLSAGGSITQFDNYVSVTTGSLTFG